MPATLMRNNTSPKMYEEHDAFSIRAFVQKLTVLFKLGFKLFSMPTAILVMHSSVLFGRTLLGIYEAHLDGDSSSLIFMGLFFFFRGNCPRIGKRLLWMIYLFVEC